MSIRRLSNCLRINRQFLPGPARKRILRQLRGINKLAGRVRDIDIALHIIFAVLKFPDKRIYRHLTDERIKKKRKLQKKLWRWIDEEQLREWYVELELLSVDRKNRPPRKLRRSAGEFAAEVLPPLATRFLEEGRSLKTESSPEILHKFRLHGKQLRDALEMFQPCYDNQVDHLLSPIRDIHRILGDFNDLVTTQRMLTERGFSASRHQLFAMLSARMAEKIDQYFRVWQQRLAEQEIQRRWRDYLATKE